MSDALIVLVEDEAHLAEGLLFNLKAEGYRTHHEADGEAARAWLLEHGHDVSAVLMDVMLPGIDGFEIVRSLRAAGLYMPILMLTARSHPQDVLDGFSAGADDYLSKPFDLSILFARISGLLRRVRWQQTAPDLPASKTPSGSIFEFGSDKCIDFENLELHSGEKITRLTLMETELLRYLVEREGKPVSRKEILEEVWRVREDTDTRAIDNFIVRLRRYLEDDPAQPKHLQTVRSIGYRFVAHAPSQ